MISTIVTIALAGYLGVLYLGFIVGFIVEIWMGEWKGLWKDFGGFLLFNSWVLIGIIIGLFTIGNIFNWFIEWQLKGLANPNVLGFICLGICISFNLMGKAIMRDREAEKAQKEPEEQRKHKYVTLKSGKRVKIE